MSDDIEDGFGYVTKSVGEYVSVEMELGDVLIFDSNLVHRSGKLYQGQHAGPVTLDIINVRLRVYRARIPSSLHLQTCKL